MEYISFDKYLKLLLKKWKLILYIVIGFIGLAVLYGLFFYSPTYTAESKILLKPDNSNTYVTQLNSDNNVYTGLGNNINPVLTQMEILTSYDIASRVVDNLSNNPTFKDYPKQNLIRAIQRRIDLSNPAGTDVIEIAVSWDNPEDAQTLAKSILDAYYNYNEAIYKKSVLNTKKYIENQLNDTNKKLLEVRDEIEKFRKDNSSINVDLEAQSIIAQIQRIENVLADVNVNISSDNKKIHELSQTLGVDLTKAIESVAVGQSTNMIKLNQDLINNQQKLASLIVKYPETNPQIKILDSQINEINKQIKNETLALIGKEQISKNNSVISDTVRAEMVNEYVKTSVEQKSLLGQRETLIKNLDQLNANLKAIPEIQKTLSLLQDNERNLSSIVDTLNAKLVEAQIKESAIVSNIDIIESPVLPISETFPTFLHILIIFSFIGFMFGIGTVLALYYVEDVCEGASEVEEIIKAPVLGIIPWLTNSSYGNLLTEYNPHSIIAIIYQKIAISLKVKCYKKKYNSIALISSEFEKRRSVVAASLANTFAKTEERVFIVDTDFRDGSLTREFNIDFSNFPDITDCILELSKTNSKVMLDEQAYYNEIVAKYIVHVPGFENLYLIPNNNKVNNPYEILNNDAFPKLMKILKASFDLVILDTPPMLAVADSIITSQHVDGLVVLCGVKASRSNLRKIKKTCDENYVEILGAIARDTITELEVPENMYIKQLSNNENY